MNFYMWDVILILLSKLKAAEVLANKKELFTQIGLKPLTFRPHNTAALPIRHLIILGILEKYFICV